VNKSIVKAAANYLPPAEYFEAQMDQDPVTDFIVEGVTTFAT